MPSLHPFGDRVATGRWPFIGHQGRMVSAGHLRWMQALRQTHDRYVWVDMGLGSPNWHIMCLDAADHKLLGNTKALSVAQYSDISGLLLGRSLLTRDPPEHTDMRSTLNRPFTPRGLSAAGVGRIVREVVERRCAALARRDEIVLLTETRELALEIIFRILGIDGEEISAWRHRYERFLLATAPLPTELPGTPRWFAAQAKRWLLARLGDRVAKIRTSGGEGLLAEMVRDWDERHPAHDQDDKLMDNVLLLALAGHETTASTMAWMGVFCAHQPEQWDALVAEARSLPHPPDTPDQLEGAPWATGVFREALRLYPPVPFISRRLVQDLEIGGQTVRAGTMLGFSLCLWSRDPQRFPEPDRFDPARWAGAPVGALEKIPFSNGAHFCLGYHVAVTEAVQFAVGLAQALDAVGRRPAAATPFPAARYMGLTHPPKAGTKVRLVAA